MSDKTLRAQIIRLAHANPKLREHLLPLVRGADKKAGKFTFNFEDAMVKIRSDLHKEKQALVQKLVQKASRSLLLVDCKVVHSEVDTYPRRWFATVVLKIEVGGDPLSRDEFEDIIEDVLGGGWQIESGGPNWEIRIDI